MLESIKNLITLKTVDKQINDGNYDSALEKLNYLINEGFQPAQTFLKRGKLCRKLFMLEDAYSDFTYIITHCAEKKAAYCERLMVNFETGNFYEAVMDANILLTEDKDNFELKRLKFLSLAFSGQNSAAKDYVSEIFGYHKYTVIKFLLDETAKSIAEDELSKALSLLSIIDIIDKDNPIKLLKESEIYRLAGQIDKQKDLLIKIKSAFPKYFISHFRFTDMYEERDLAEICFLLELKIFDEQNLFSYPMVILEGYKNQMNGHIIDAKECFERAIEIKPEKPEAYVLLGQTLQLMSGYDNPDYKYDAEKNYIKALEIYERDNIPSKAANMKLQIKHLNSMITI